MIELLCKHAFERREGGRGSKETKPVKKRKSFNT